MWKRVSGSRFGWRCCRKGFHGFSALPADCRLARWLTTDCVRVERNEGLRKEGTTGIQNRMKSVGRGRAAQGRIGRKEQEIELLRLVLIYSRNLIIGTQLLSISSSAEDKTHSHSLNCQLMLLLVACVLISSRAQSRSMTTQSVCQFLIFSQT